ncbi:MAG: hypothetical protein V1799_20335 [bacterium]
MKILQHNHWIVVCLALLAASGCSTSSDPSASQNSDLASEYLMRAWKEFESKRYDAASLLFTDAINSATTDSVKADGYSGRGWSALLSRKLSNALSDYDKALNISQAPEPVKIDAKAGRSYAQFAAKDFSGTIASASEVLRLRSSYTFSHASAVTATQVRLLLAQSYFATGQYYQAAQQLDILNPQQAPHSSDPTLLLAKITSLVSIL